MNIRNKNDNTSKYLVSKLRNNYNHSINKKNLNTMFDDQIKDVIEYKKDIISTIDKIND